MRRQLLVVMVSAVLSAGLTVAFADDGEQVLKSMSKNIKGVAEEIAISEHVYVDMMRLYVPLQAASGADAAADYLNADGDSEGLRDLGKPLISVFQHGPVEFVEEAGGFVGHGKRDAYAGVSLDDGLTWKATNLSESADLVSSKVCRDDLVDLYGACGTSGGGGQGGGGGETGNYPGDVVNIFQATAPSFSGTAGNYALAVWPSRYCSGGEPNYSLLSGDEPGADKLARFAAIADELGIELDDTGLPVPSPAALYLTDMYGVGGSQGSVDYAEDKFAQNHPVGEVPFNCLWAARGVLLAGDDPRTDETTESSYMRWFKAERLTSGTRDVNRVETSCVAGVGCAVTWQEDPSGLRPGQGEGPGEGWSGAIANSQTDIWYSYIEWDQFTKVQNPDETSEDLIIPLDNYELAALGGDVTQKPKPGIPFAMPMRMTDNARCNVANPKPYCQGSAIYVEDSGDLNPLDYGLKDMCKDLVEIPTGPQGTLAPICVTEDGLPLVGNIASTRPRLSLRGYDKNDDGILDGAFAIVVSEESKGLGAFGFTEEGETGAPCDPETDEGCIPFDDGKNIWYYSFDMSLTGPFADKADGLVANLAGHGNMLNQPEVNWKTGEFYTVRNTADLWNFANEGKDYNYEIWNTETARRGSLLDQDIYKAEASSSRLTALPSWKQGTMNQGGPADVMLRRIVLAGSGNGNGGTCPIVEDAGQPVITSASWDGKGKLSVQGTGADGDASTKVLVRNAVNQLLVGSGGDGKTGAFKFDININTNQNKVPCAVQAADEVKKGTALYGPYVMVVNAPLDCEPPVPDVCTNPPPPSAGWDGSSNPYAFRNMECNDWLYGRDPQDGRPINPFYPDGLCIESAINLSGTIPDTCVDSENPNEIVPCPSVDFITGSTTFGIGDTEPVLQGRDVVPNKTKVLSWHQCPFSKTEGTTTVGEGSPVNILDCATDLRTDGSTLRDQSWYNPLDVAKGHRGYLDGDFVMVLYAWSPNWRLNVKGSDRYELYIRRSFDGAQTWTTLPANYAHHDGSEWTGSGTVTCETFRSATTQASGDLDEPRVCNWYQAGAPEQARNVTQHKSMRITTLDPRYAPTAETIQDWANIGWAPPNYHTTNGLPEDMRDPSRYFIVYETGDNTTTQEGEPEPLDLFYGRAINFGDDYVVWAEETGEGDEGSGLQYCYPNEPYGQLDEDDVRIGSGFCNEFDLMEQGRKGIVSGEASLEANPGGEFLYGVWEQEELNLDDGDLIDADAMFRRIWWIDGFIPENAWIFGQGDGSGTPANP